MKINVEKTFFIDDLLLVDRLFAKVFEHHVVGKAGEVYLEHGNESCGVTEVDYCVQD